MRQALFAVVLVAASFAGGAVVNGPGLRWAQTAVMNRLGLHSDDDENGDAHKPGTAAGAGEVDGIPTSPIPPLVVEPSLAAPARSVEKTKGKEGPGPARDRDRDRDKPSPSFSSLPTSEGPHAPEPGVVANVPEPTPARAQAPGPPPAAVVFPSASGIEVPVLERPEPLSATPREPGAQSRAPDNATPLKDRPTPEKIRKDAAVALASIAGKAASPSSSNSPAMSPPTAAAPGEPADWAGVRRALRNLGVSRYGTDGESDGRVRFHCVIPLAGRRAVGQHFEAEGDDELQAARSVLRRIALWRATEADGAGRAP